jgi:polyisoprenoid-binding protein YceI
MCGRSRTAETHRISKHWRKSMTSEVTSTDIVLVPPAGQYRIDADRSTVAFTTRHYFGLAGVRGTFPIREGQIQVADPVEGSSVQATILATMNTGNSTRDRNIRSSGYLDVERNPIITFTSTTLEQLDGNWFLHGSLTVRGTSNELELRIRSVSINGKQILLRAESTVDRHAFGISKMKGMIARELRFQLNITAERV